MSIKSETREEHDTILANHIKWLTEFALKHLDDSDTVTSDMLPDYTIDEAYSSIVLELLAETDKT